MRPLGSSSLLALRFAVPFAVVAGTSLVVSACGSEEGTPSSEQPDAAVSLDDVDAGRPVEGGAPVGEDAASALRGDRFATRVVSFTPGACAGFGASSMPGIVLGPPDGRGAGEGSFDVVSLGIGGEIVLSVEPNAIVDGPGPDFIVFENAFYASGDPTRPAFDPGEVSVSEDGVTWTSFGCDPAVDGGATTGQYGPCAGWHPVYSARDNAISPVDPTAAGGDPYDLATLGLSRVRFVRVKDRSSQTCDGDPRPNNLGFDLDAIAIINAESP